MASRQPGAPPPSEIDFEVDVPRRVRAVALPTTTTTKLIYGGECKYQGGSALETTGSAAAVIELYDGRDTTGQLIAVIQLPSGTSQLMRAPSKGVTCENGLFVNVVSGSVRGAIWFNL